MDRHLVSKPASKAEIELGSSVDNGTPKRSGTSHRCAAVSRKQAEEFAKAAARAT